LKQRRLAKVHKETQNSDNRANRHAINYIGTGSRFGSLPSPPVIAKL
jgi:hypothetical protein